MSEECLKFIYTRRSIRDYSEKEISEEDLQKILRAGFQAPTAANEQPWHFIVVRRRDLLEKIAESHPYAKMLKKASAAIIVCADPKRSRFPYRLWDQDCSAATQNILLAARILGIGSVWIGIYPREDFDRDVKEILGIPTEIVVFSIISLGYPKSESEFREAEDRFKEDRIHRDGW
jgi:nitroreductase